MTLSPDMLDEPVSPQPSRTKYQYDDAGNRTLRTTTSTGETLTYSWDHRQRLTGLTYRSANGTVTRTVAYAYDTADRRISKTVTGDQSLTEYYVYDADQLLLVLDGSGTVQQRLFFGPGQDQLLAQEDTTAGLGAPGTTRWAFGDQENSVRDVTDSTGSPLEHTVYSSFGTRVSPTAPTNALRLGYTGQQYDPESGLSYNKARYYDVANGRFLSEDPSGYAAGDDNLYRYVGNNPASRTDPTGLSARGIGQLFGPAVGAIGANWTASFGNPLIYSSQSSGALESTASSSGSMGRTDPSLDGTPTSSDAITAPRLTLDWFQVAEDPSAILPSSILAAYGPAPSPRQPVRTSASAPPVISPTAENERNHVSYYQYYIKDQFPLISAAEFGALVDNIGERAKDRVGWRLFSSGSLQEDQAYAVLKYLRDEMGNRPRTASTALHYFDGFSGNERLTESLAAQALDGIVEEENAYYLKSNNGNVGIVSAAYWNIGGPLDLTGSRIGDAAVHLDVWTANAYDRSVENTVAIIARNQEMEHPGTFHVAPALRDGLGHILGSWTGAEPFMEGIAGVTNVGAQPLDDMGRAQHILMGGAQMTLVFTPLPQFKPSAAELRYLQAATIWTSVASKALPAITFTELAAAGRVGSAVARTWLRSTPETYRLLTSAAAQGVVGSAVSAQPTALIAEESAQSIISRVAQQQANRGAAGLRDLGFLSDRQWAAYSANPAGGRRFLGTAVHESTAAALEELHPGRFLYNRVGADFVDTMTGEVLELTTPGQVGAHMVKPGYRWVTYSTYTLPK